MSCFFPQKAHEALWLICTSSELERVKENVALSTMSQLCAMHTLLLNTTTFLDNFCGETTSFSLQLLCQLGTRYAAEVFAITLRGGLADSFPTRETLMLRYLVG